MYWKAFWRMPEGATAAGPPVVDASASASASASWPSGPDMGAGVSGLPADAAIAPAAAPAAPAASEEDALASFYEMLAPSLAEETAAAPAVLPPPPAGTVAALADRAVASGAGLSNAPVRYNPQEQAEAAAALASAAADAEAAGQAREAARAAHAAAALVDESEEAGGLATAARRGPPVIDTEALVDREKVHCLLCQRAFKKMDTLDKHIQLSDLHRVRTTVPRTRTLARTLTAWTLAFVRRQHVALSRSGKPRAEASRSLSACWGQVGAAAGCGRGGGANRARGRLRTGGGDRTRARAPAGRQSPDGLGAAGGWMSPTSAQVS